MAELKIPKFKVHFKLEFDIKTDMENMQEVLWALTRAFEVELTKVDKPTKIELIPTIVKITAEDDEGITEKT